MAQRNGPAPIRNMKSDEQPNRTSRTTSYATLKAPATHRCSVFRQQNMLKAFCHIGATPFLPNSTQLKAQAQQVSEIQKRQRVICSFPRCCAHQILRPNDSYLTCRAAMSASSTSTKTSATAAQAAISATLSAAIAKGYITDRFPVAIFYDLDHIRINAQELLDAFPSDALHGFALKAVPLVALLRELHAVGLGAECASPAELAVCQAASLPPSKVIFDSPAKTDTVLRSALQTGVHVNADNIEELDRIQPILTDFQSSSTIGLRVNPQLGSAEIAETFTAAAASKFGEPLREKRKEIVEAFVRFDFLSTIHVHVGSQGCAVDVLVAGANAAADLANEINEIVPGRVTAIDIGGGLSADYWSDAEVTSFEDLGNRLKREVPHLFKYRILTEFGRRIAASTAFMAARVEYIKRSGGKTFVVCHAGADLLMRAVYHQNKWSHRVEVYDKTGLLKEGQTETVDIAGPICFNGDIIATDRELPLPEPGDLIVIRDTGAYTLSMYSRHTSQLTPAVYGFEASKPGEFKLLKKGETVQDVVRFWDIE